MPAGIINLTAVSYTHLDVYKRQHDTLCKHGGFMTCQDRYNPGFVLVTLGSISRVGLIIQTTLQGFHETVYTTCTHT